MGIWRKFIRKLIDKIDFDEVIGDCVEFQLKEYKIDYKTLKESKANEVSENAMASLKALVLDAFLLRPADSISGSFIENYAINSYLC